MEQDFLEDASRDRLPIRLIAFKSSELAGTIVLREQGSESLPEFQPELGGLYVIESHLTGVNYKRRPAYTRSNERGHMNLQANEEFEKVLSVFNPDVQEIAREARSLIYESLPQAVEVVWERQKTVGYGTGPKKMSEHFCWIAPYKKHVVLGFYYGTELPDPEHILEGTGKLMRHVKLSRLEDLRNPAIRDLIKVATRHRVPPPKEQ